MPSISGAALRRAAALGAACAVLAAGCATPPPPPAPKRTTVTLLPDDDGRVGAVTVSGMGDAGAGPAQLLDQAYRAVVITPGTAEAVVFAERDRDAVEATHAELMRAQPPRPASFTLNFVLDSSALTPESEALVKTVVQAALTRKPTEITVFGHADESGTPDRNLKLSAERAQFVADLLRRADPALGTIEVQYFGDRVPLIATGGRKAEPRNRRVEVSIL